jgi:hypothetical protein
MHLLVGNLGLLSIFQSPMVSPWVKRSGGRLGFLSPAPSQESNFVGTVSLKPPPLTVNKMLSAPELDCISSSERARISCLRQRLPGLGGSRKDGGLTPTLERPGCSLQIQPGSRAMRDYRMIVWQVNELSYSVRHPRQVGDGGYAQPRRQIACKESVVHDSTKVNGLHASSPPSTADCRCISLHLN